MTDQPTRPRLDEMTDDRLDDLYAYLDHAVQRADRAEATLRRVRDAQTWGAVWAQLGQYYGMTAEDARLAARSRRSRAERDAEARAERAERERDEQLAAADAQLGAARRVARHYPGLTQLRDALDTGPTRAPQCPTDPDEGHESHTHAEGAHTAAQSPAEQPVLRGCLMPGCTAQMDLLASVDSHRQPARDEWHPDKWRQVPRGLAPGHVCPDHAAHVTAHLPTWQPHGPARWTAACACGWTTGPHAHAVALRGLWQEHLVVAAEPGCGRECSEQHTYAGRCELAPDTAPEDTGDVQPPVHCWRVQVLDRITGEYSPGVRYDSRDEAAARLAYLEEHLATYLDGTPAQRRLVRETTTWTVESPAQHPTDAAAGHTDDVVTEIRIDTTSLGPLRHIAYRSVNGRILRCPAHTMQTAVQIGAMLPIAATDLPQGSTCATCGVTLNLDRGPQDGAR